MHNRLIICGAATAIVLSAIAPAALAQENTLAFTCLEIGSGAPPPRGDREGDLISVEQDRCRVDSGPLIGGVLIEAIIWEWNKTKTNATLLSGSGVIRKPGSMVAFQITDGKLAVTITDGKVTGATSSGRGNDGIATGDAAALAGKSFTWSTKSTGTLRFTLEVEME